MRIVVSKDRIISAIAYCGIQQSPYLFPKNLEKALTALGKAIDEKGIFNAEGKNVLDNYKGFEEVELRDLLKNLVFNTPEIQIWNVTQVEQDNGIKLWDDKKRTIKYAATSRYGAMQSEDNDFIDLDALRSNVLGMLYNQD